MIEKSKIIRNTLVQEIIRIDFLKIDDISEILAKIEPVMTNYGFIYSSEDVYDLNIEINDPQELITQKFITNVNKTTNYCYIKNDEKFVINEFMIYFQKLNFENYISINPYVKLFKEIMNIIFEEKNISIKRIGVRKINRVLGTNLEAIIGIFGDNDISADEILMYPGYENKRRKVLYDAEKISLNIIKNIDKGFGKLKDSEKLIEMYSTFLDLDAYSRNFVKEMNNTEIERILNELSDKLYKTFMTYENDILKRVLTDINSIKDLGIVEGINVIKDEAGKLCK